MSGPAEAAAAMAADPQWRFTEDPVAAIGHATTVAAEHYKAGRTEQARTWTRIGLELSVLAGRSPGASIRTLAQSLGVALP